MVIDNQIWLNPGCEPETNDCIFCTISLTVVIFCPESCAKPFLPIAAIGVTIQAIKLNNRLSNSKSSVDSKIFSQDFQYLMILNKQQLSIAYSVKIALIGSGKMFSSADNKYSD